MYPNGADFGLSLTFDIEMCTNFPYWTSVWDHRKGAIDEDSKLYMGKMLDVADTFGVKFQFFLVGRALEDPDIDYLKRMTAEGHAVDNHTYNHVSVKAQDIPQLQPVYANAPWRAAGLNALECIEREVRQTSTAITEKLGVAPTGFRTPGGFNNGLDDVPAVQEVLSDAGMQYASARYYFPVDPEQKRPSADVLNQAMEASVDALQPSRYPNGLPELPLAGITDIWAFRVLDLDRWEFINVLKRGIDHAHANRQVLSLCFHPPVLAVRDPHCDMLNIVLRYALEKPGGCWITTNQEMVAHTLN